MKMRRPLAPTSVSNETPFRLPCWHGLVGPAAAALLLGACVEDVDPNATVASAAGSAGMGSTVVASGGSAGSTPGGNAAGSGGSGANAYASDPTFATGARCPALTQALLSDFTFAPVASADAGAGTDAGAGPNTTGITFGDFTNTFSGSSYVYPNAGTYAVGSDVTGSNWHLTGSIGDYSGFGFVFVGCSSLDASAYRGISFTVQGSVPMGSSITFNVGTAADDVSHVWLNAVAMPMTPAPVNAGRCIPAAMQYDGTCTAPNRTIPVTAERTTVNVLWAELTGGAPRPRSIRRRSPA